MPKDRPPRRFDWDPYSYQSKLLALMDRSSRSSQALANKRLSQTQIVHEKSYGTQTLRLTVTTVRLQSAVMPDKEDVCDQREHAYNTEGLTYPSHRWSKDHDDQMWSFHLQEAAHGLADTDERRSDGPTQGTCGQLTLPATIPPER